MCSCGQPTINGQPGYRWQPTDTPSVRPVQPPALTDEDTLLYDEPGRCGGLDGHSHHFRLVRRYGSVHLLTRNGSGEERFRVSTTPSLVGALAAMDSNARYWTLSALYYAHNDGARTARAEEAARWYRAAVEKRIKVRKVRGEAVVSILPQKT
jgi:hypothetical protein